MIRTTGELTTIWHSLGWVWIGRIAWGGSGQAGFEGCGWVGGWVVRGGVVSWVAGDGDKSFGDSIVGTSVCEPRTSLN